MYKIEVSLAPAWADVDDLDHHTLLVTPALDVKLSLILASIACAAQCSTAQHSADGDMNEA
jgi:hypothetical protein